MADFLDSKEIVETLHGFNPWWSNGPNPVPVHARLALRLCLGFLNDPSMRRAVLLSGPRQVGKTTIQKQIAARLLEDEHEARSILYVTLDHPLLKLAGLPRILKLYHEFVFPSGKSATLLLDEVQYASDWDVQVKLLVDHHPEYRIMATGSAALALRQGVTDSGVGRWVTVPIPTLSFYEFLHIRDEKPESVPRDLRPTDLLTAEPDAFVTLTQQCRALMPLFRRYLLVGGFPATALQPDIALSLRLLREDVVERVLKRDMASVFRIRSIDDLEKLFIYLCLHSGGIMSIKTCATALGVTTTTVSNHLEALERANLIYRLAPTAVAGKKRLKLRHKVYLADAALANAVLLRGEEVLNDPTRLGAIVETAILRHVYAYYYPDTPSIGYWRDSATQREVDIVVRGPGYLIPVEVKHRAARHLKANDGVVTFSRAEDVRHAFVITQGDDDFGVERVPDVGTKFLRIPAHIFTYLIGQAEFALWTESAADTP